jgi:ribonuclease P/MRP protein subunit RPP40
MHIGRTNPSFEYYMTNYNTTETSIIDEVLEEKDLGVTFDPSLKFSKHIANCASKANKVLGLIRRTFECLDSDMFLVLYKYLVRPHTEYASGVWNPWLKKDIRCLENVQRKATKLVKELRNLGYSDRLKQLGIPTLEYRRKMNDLIQVFKILKGIDDTNSELFFEYASVEKTRGHSLKLFMKQSSTQLRNNNFLYG